MNKAETGPKEWSDWEKYRDQVIHPAGTVKAEDIARARENISRHDWAARYVDEVTRSAEDIAATVTGDYLERMIEWTTPGCVGPCPACRAKGLPWHPNGQWTWSPEDPERITCDACGSVFPHDDFPEDIVIESTWGRGQKFTFVGGDTFKCFQYLQARPSISGIIRVRKVAHVTRQLEQLANAHALTGNPAYAAAAKSILLRLADVFPEYLVRAGYGYGEYAGMDPRIAAEHINDLPEDELVYPPNVPDRKLFAGYWAASRIGTSGMDGNWVVRVCDAYSLTREARADGEPVYSDEDRIHIERDVLLESTYLAVCDPAINNKSVGNRAGCAIAGMVTGHAGLVHFGLDGFVRTVDDWFLPDGGTSESPAYAMMTMNGIRPFALAFRSYTDPESYVGPDGTRLNGFNACRDTLYGDCWQALRWTLQGDLRFPPSADSYRQTSISAAYGDLLALAYPTDEHVALLRELIARSDRNEGDASAVFYRAPDIDTRDVPPVRMDDVLFPFLKQGHLRTGDDGRESLVLLNAADHANHHHIDGLGLYYWKDGRELLSDLGYLWDHQEKYQTARTGAHNLVMIDGKDQLGRGRHGAFHLFSPASNVKAMEASTDGYGTEDVYRRTCILVDHGVAGSYLLDIFRAYGGECADYIFHGPNNDCAVDGIALEPRASTDPVALGEQTPELSSLREGTGASPWRISWRFEDGYTFDACVPGSADESVYLGDGWGQRDHRNTDVGAVLPYVVRRRTANRTEPFVTAFTGSPGARAVESVSLLPCDDAPLGAVAAWVTTPVGGDLVVSMLDTFPVTVSTTSGPVSTDARVAVVSFRDGKAVSGYMLGGTQISAPGFELEAPSAGLSGKVVGSGSQDGDSWFDIDGDPETVASQTGQTLFVTWRDSRHGYPIRAVAPAPNGCRVFTKQNHVGFEARGATRWELPVTVHHAV